MRTIKISKRRKKGSRADKNPRKRKEKGRRKQKTKRDGNYSNFKN